jgi:hypothetical protein
MINISITALDILLRLRYIGKLRNGELYNLYSPPNIIRQIKSRRMRWERGETCTGFWWESQRERDHLKDQGVDGKMGKKWTLGRLVGGVELIQLAQDRDRWRAVVNAVMNLRVLAPQSQSVSQSVGWLVGWLAIYICTHTTL